MLSSLKKDLNKILSDSFEIECILLKVLNCSKLELMLNDVKVTKNQYKQCIDMANKRKTAYPLQYILGSWNFYGIELKIALGCLIPRPETELICEQAIKIIGDNHLDVIDLCAGSGCIGAAILKHCKNAKVVSVEISKKALNCLKENLPKDSEIILADVCDPQTLNKLKSADLIISNPPYLDENSMQNLQRELEFDPKLALFGGEDGMYYYNKIIPLYIHKLKPGGYFLFEIGYKMDEKIKRLCYNNDLVDIEVIKDYSKIPRIIKCKKQGD